jgi:hypothetical protein
LAFLCRALQEVRRGKREAYFAKVDKKRGEWLQKLNAEAQTWIAQADIDKVQKPVCLVVLI